MKFSISTAFIIFAFAHAASIVSASPVNQQGGQQGGKQGGNNNNGNNNGNNANNNGNNNNNGGGNNNNGIQSSLQLDPSVIGSNLAKNGIENGKGTEAGEAPSQTSKNNFINGCLGKTITNGLQIPTGSCNPVPMGDIPSSKNQPSAKFASPTNFETITANAPITITMTITGMETGNFVNPDTNYFAAPQQLNQQGVIIGHSHVVIQKISSITSTDVPDPTSFAFFQGLNAPAAKGKLSAELKKGLPPGVYRLSSINTAANHQPVIGPVAQHGSFDDAIYFTVTADGKPAAGGNAGTANVANVGAGAGAQSSATNAANAKETTTAKNAKATQSANGKATKPANGKGTRSAKKPEASHPAEQNNKNAGGFRRFVSERNA